MLGLLKNLVFHFVTEEKIQTLPDGVFVAGNGTTPKDTEFRVVRISSRDLPPLCSWFFIRFCRIFRQ